MLSRQFIDALNRIKYDVNEEYGFKDGYPRINMGPCGYFALIFYIIWTELFKELITICFLFSPDDEHCFHCFIKLPDGNYFDGGNGFVPAEDMRRMIPDDWRVEEMTEFDEQRLATNSDGFFRKYSNCPNFSAARVRVIIQSHLRPLTLEM